jgi:hypothetical protein
MVLSSLTQKPESITSHGFCFLSRRRNRQWRSVWGNLWLSGSSPRRSPPGGYSARVKGLDTQVRALES